MKQAIQIKNQLSSYKKIRRICSLIKTLTISRINTYRTSINILTQANKIISGYKQSHDILTKHNYKEITFSPDKKYYIWWLGIDKKFGVNWAHALNNEIVAQYNHFTELNINHNLYVLGDYSYRKIKNCKSNAILLDFDNLVNEISVILQEIQHNITTNAHWYLFYYENEAIQMHNINYHNIKDKFDLITIRYCLAEIINAVLLFESQTRLQLAEGASQFTCEAIEELLVTLHQIYRDNITNDLNILSNFII